MLRFTLYLRAISKYKPPGGLYLEGRFNRGFFALRVWGAYTWRGLFSEFYGISKQDCKLTTVLHRTIQYNTIQILLSTLHGGFSETSINSTGDQKKNLNENKNLKKKQVSQIHYQ